MNKRIEFHLQSPVNCTSEQFEEWVRYHFGLSAGIDTNNPLLNYDMAGNVDDLTIDGIDID